MDVHIKINTDNAAFEGNANPEVARILRDLADKTDGWVFDVTPGASRKLFDMNGNAVGYMTVK